MAAVASDAAALTAIATVRNVIPALAPKIIASPPRTGGVGGAAGRGRESGRVGGAQEPDASFQVSSMPVATVVWCCRAVSTSDATAIRPLLWGFFTAAAVVRVRKPSAPYVFRGPNNGGAAYLGDRQPT